MLVKNAIFTSDRFLPHTHCQRDRCVSQKKVNIFQESQNFFQIPIRVY